MSLKYSAWAAPEKGEKFAKVERTLPKTLGEEDVCVKVCYTGLCQSDVAMWNNSWYSTTYPFVGGHEGVGYVHRIGSRVTRMKVGDRVGVTWSSKSCLVCDSCTLGELNNCTGEIEDVIVGRDGTFAEFVVVNQMWAIPVPKGIAYDRAGPLLCGGVTGFTPIMTHNINATHRVGVVGIGGIGSMVISFLKAFGADITAFSSSDRKKDEAMKLGASRYVSSIDAKAIRSTQKMDLIIVCACADLEWSAFVAALRPHGRLHFIGATSNPIQALGYTLFSPTVITGSKMGKPIDYRKMLELVVRHKNCTPVVEVLPIEKINEAFSKLVDEKPPHRLVFRICKDDDCECQKTLKSDDNDDGDENDNDNNNNDDEDNEEEKQAKKRKANDNDDKKEQSDKADNDEETTPKKKPKKKKTKK